MISSIITQILLAFTLTTNTNVNVVDWQIGDALNHNIKVSFLSGTAVREVTSEVDVEGETAIWVDNNVRIMGQTQSARQLIRRSDAKILKLIVNGEEKEIPTQEDIEIVDQDYRSVTVPAGTFQSVYIKLNTKQAKGVEVWMNPAETCMDGVLKMKTPTQFGTATSELTGFHKVQ